MLVINLENAVLKDVYKVDDKTYLKLKLDNVEFIINVDNYYHIVKLFTASDLTEEEIKLIKFLNEEYFSSDNLCVFLSYDYLKEAGFSKVFIWETLNKLISLNDDFADVIEDYNEDVGELLLYGNYITYFNLEDF